MANSLQDQLLQAGVANKKQAKKAKHAQRMEKNRAKKGIEQEETAAERARRKQKEQAEKDRQLAAAQKAKREEEEIGAQVRQLIDSNQLPREEGDQPYQFVQAKKINKIYVTAKQLKQLSNGYIGIVAKGDDFALVPTVVAEKIGQRDEAAVLVLHLTKSKSDNTRDEDDPYADYPIPDDLMW